MLSVERTGVRDRPDELMEALFAEAFPAWITADREAKRWIDRARELFTELDLMLLDGEQLVTTGWAVPIRWSGEVADLSSGYTATIRAAVELAELGGEPDTLVICGGVVHPDRRGTGAAAALITALGNVAGTRGWPRVIAPIRPTLKHRYPLASIDEYVAWNRPDGSPFDPWVRLHTRIGCRVLATAPASQTMTGTVGEWEGWTGMAFPADGDYVIPDGLSALSIDRAADLGTYVEPNVWVQHR